MIPPIAYYGGKVGLGRRIVELLPPHRVYVEPFFGSGAVLFAKAPAQIEVANDLDHNVITFFRVLRERPDELERACRLTPYARLEYETADLADEDLDDLERARRFWVRVNQSFAKVATRQTGWSFTVARSQSTANSAWSRISRFAAAVERLQRVVFECCDAVELIGRAAKAPDTCAYVDPPYPASTRRGQDREHPRDYFCDMGDPESHRRLAEVLRETPASVVLSTYPSDLYEELYGDWWHVDFHRKIHASNSVTRERGERVERVYLNRPPAHTLFTEEAPA